ncbi:asparagine synthase-related protein [Thermoflavimicrobium daqui]|uniref:asparagine synthase (glutamine-hydrolyzing) n=1 Tax=Thermoflavimicrobium daqui TaxID=2137476 RepID=A0A364K675_9BACL|nr:asparagine synthase-related protein [Thermoflavimicrobium daqui]RAL25712.1 hypothetical protein DL897_06450 [Thermoflavimicrobium daqui]
MFFGIFEGQSFSVDQITDSYIRCSDKDSECVLIGEILSDEEEIYNAFRRFLKEQKPEHIIFLRGNYQSFIRIGEQLWAFSDLGNVRPIFYMKFNNRWFLSSHLLLLNEKVNSSLNLPWFQRSLSSFGFHIEMETPYKEVRRVPGGFGLHIKNKKEQVFQAWNVDQESTLSLDEAGKLLREELTSSILLRCQGKRVTSDLSGGLDSSTITWIAAKKYPVKSITITGREENEDVRIAKEIAKRQKNINQIIFNQNEMLHVYANMDQIRTDIPIPFFWSANNAKAMFTWARKNKSEIHFSGEGGDSVLGADYTYLVDLVRQGKWGTFISHAKGWANKKNQSPWSYISGAIRLALNIPFEPQQRHPLSSSSNKADWFKFSTIINKGSYSKFMGVSNTLDGIHYLGYVAHGLKDLASQEKVNLSVPYLDHNVLRICLRVKSEDKMKPNELKPLLKRAFQHELPQCLLNRNSKGDYTSDVYNGMKENFSWFDASFKQMYLAEMGLVDLNKFRECFHRLLIGAPVRLPEFHLTLSLEMWLRQSTFSSSKGREEYEVDHTRSC